MITNDVIISNESVNLLLTRSGIVSVPCSPVVICWERADHLVVVCCVFLCFVTFPNVFWSASGLGERFAPWNWFKPSSKIFYWPFLGGTSLVDHLCYLCLVFYMLSRLFIAALWPPAAKGLTSWLLFVCLIVFLSLSHLVSWVCCGTWLYRFLFFAAFPTYIIRLNRQKKFKPELTKWHSC